MSDTLEPQIDSMKEVLQKAKVLADNVQISSVIQSLDQNNEKVDLLNVGLISLCEEAGVKYIDNRPRFTTQDGEVNGGYLANDGIHLSRAGTNKLVKNLKLKMKSSDVYCQSASPHKTPASTPWFKEESSNHQRCMEEKKTQD